jgi:DNA-binding transcriptional ArsR family regulator
MSRPWLKSWVDILDNPKVMGLAGGTYKVWSCCLHIACRHDRDGLLPSLDKCAFILHVRQPELQAHIDALIEAGLVDASPEGYRMHDWEDWQTRKPSDEPERVKERVSRHREAKRVDTAGVTPRNALQNVTESVTPRNARNAVKTRGEEIRQEEKRVEVPREDAPDAAVAASTLTRSTKPLKSKKTPLPDPFRVTEEMFAWAESRGYAEEFVRLSTEYFVNWAEAHDHRYVDWIAVWRNVLDSRAKEHGGNVVQLRRA